MHESCGTAKSEVDFEIPGVDANFTQLHGQEETFMHMAVVNTSMYSAVEMKVARTVFRWLAQGRGWRWAGGSGGYKCKNIVYSYFTLVVVQ